MKYSFIIPVYNVEVYLSKCLDSLLAQTYKDFEIILIDDGSTDSSGIIADRYAQRYSEIIHVEHQQNTGQGGARNKGILMAQGTYLIMVDSDDYVSEKMLETVDTYLLKYNDDILIYNFIMEEEDGTQIVQQLHAGKTYISISPKEYIFEAPAPWNKVIRASLFKETDIRFPERIFYEDLATSPCLAIYANHIGAIKDTLYFYRQRESSTMHSNDTQRMLEVCAAVEFVLKYFKQKGRYEEYYQELEFLTVSNVLCSTVQRILYVKYDYKKIQLLEQFVEHVFPDYQNNWYVKNCMNKAECRREKQIIEKKHFELWIGYVLRKWKRKVKKIIKGF